MYLPGNEAAFWAALPTTSDQFLIGRMIDVSDIYGPREAYSVASIYRKLWLPAAQPPSQGASGTSGNNAQSPDDRLFLLDAPAPADGAAGAARVTLPTISQGSLKSKIAALEAEANKGGTPEYRKCVEVSYRVENILRSEIALYGPMPHFRLTSDIGSGLPAGTFVYDIKPRIGASADKLGLHWFKGPDKDLVTGVNVDIRPSYDGVRYTRRVVTTRPLPAGAYTVNPGGTWHGGIVCARYPAIADNYEVIEIAVTAPAGVLHEAFFDPVAIGSAVGADGTNGVLEPAAFTVGGASATITSLKWQSGTATMVLNPSASLAGHAVDFIALDGSVTSTLAFDDATQSGGTLTWSAATQPWNAGDKLMLRIRPAAPAPAISISELDASIEEGGSDAFTVSASNLATANSYSIRVTTGDANVGFDAGCASRQQDAAVSSGSTSHDAAFTLHGCSAPGGTVTATLMQGAAAVATATQQVTVTEAPIVQAAPAPTGLRVTGSTRTGVSLGWSAVRHAHRYKLERSPDGASGWSDVDDDISGTSRTVSGLSCGTTYHFRVSARGDGSTYSTEFGSPSTPSVSGATSACPTAAQPAISISGLDASMEEDASDAFTVSASNLASSTSYTIRVTTGGANVGFDAGCASRQQDAAVSSGNTSHDASFTLHGCSAPGGAVTATLMQGAAAVATATQQVTVTTPTDTETDSAVTRYDTNGDGVIDVHEYLAALRDYGEGKITWTEVLEVAEAYEKARG